MANGAFGFGHIRVAGYRPRGCGSSLEKDQSARADTRQCSEMYCSSSICGLHVSSSYSSKIDKLTQRGKSEDEVSSG
jgi:hypothetical protein